MTRFRLFVLATALASLTPCSLFAQALDRNEQRMRDYVASMRADQIAYLARVVNIPSGTMNFAGVRRVGDVFRATLDSLGFRTRWVPMDSAHRAGHLVAEHRGAPGATRMLIIGHLDTVFEGEGQGWVVQDSMALGAGGNDMKGGDVIALYAIKAMAAAGVLAPANITLVFTGDEESSGSPLALARRDLIEAAKQSDAALAFEGGNRSNATVARRGDAEWLLTVTGKQSHSSGIFGDSAGYGAIFEAARILDEMRRTMAGQPFLTFSPGIIVGGTTATFDVQQYAGTASGKSNIVPRTLKVHGDMRFLSDSQMQATRATMREIASHSLPGTSATIAFDEEFYPAMSPTAGNYRILAVYDSASRALGYGPVEALDPGRRGAGDISFVAPFVDGLDGLGALGKGSHSPEERVLLPALAMQTERAALLMYRLSKQKPKVTKR